MTSVVNLINVFIAHITFILYVDDISLLSVHLLIHYEFIMENEIKNSEETRNILQEM